MSRPSSERIAGRALVAIGDFLDSESMNNSPQLRPPGPRDLYVMPCAAEGFVGMVVDHGRLPVRLHFTLADGREFHLPISDIALRQLASALAALRPSQERISDKGAHHGAAAFLRCEEVETAAMPRSTSKPILSRLPEGMSAQLFARAKTCHLNAGDTLFSAGDAGDGCYRLEEGLLKVVITSPRGEERILAILGPGEIAGELSIVDRQPRSASVIAVKDCKLSFISQKNFEECTKQNPDTYRYLVNVLASRLRETNQAVAADTFLNVKARLARALLELSEYLGEHAGAGRVLIHHKISQNDLAAMAGVARENVNRTLSEWKRLDLVTHLSGFYCLNDITTLKRYSVF
jgi:CRP/FNR family transcriptional regulator, cyclic AMP receptor protein